MNWSNVFSHPPDRNRAILVIDSWNIDENDTIAESQDTGHVNQDFMSFRVAIWSPYDSRWSTTTNEQRVRFEWYMYLDIPQEMTEQGFCIDDGDVTRQEENSMETDE